MVKANIKDIEKEISKILKKLGKNYDLESKIDIDSLLFVRFVMEIEKKFKFKFTTKEMFDEKFNQISFIAKIVKSK